MTDLGKSFNRHLFTSLSSNHLTETRTDPKDLRICAPVDFFTPDFGDLVSKGAIAGANEGIFAPGFNAVFSTRFFNSLSAFGLYKLKSDLLKPALGNAETGVFIVAEETGGTTQGFPLLHNLVRSVAFIAECCRIS